MDVLNFMKFILANEKCPKYITCSMGCPLYINNRCVLNRITDASNDEELIKILHEPIDK